MKTSTLIDLTIRLTIAAGTWFTAFAVAGILGADACTAFSVASTVASGWFLAK